MIDRELTNCAQKARRKPQIVAARRVSGRPGPLHTIGGLPHAGEPTHGQR